MYSTLVRTYEDIGRLTIHSHIMFYKHHQIVNNDLPSIRKAAKVTQQQLADNVGVTRQTIIAIEKGNYIPSVLLALKLSHRLDCSVERIFSL